MPVRLTDFWDHAVQDGLIPANAIEAIKSAWRESQGANSRDQTSQNGGPKVEPEAIQIADFLVQHDRLTPLQAECLLADPPIPTRFGSYRLLSRETPKPFSMWIEASRDIRGYLIRGPVDHSGIRQHANVAHRFLMACEIEAIADQLAVFVPAPDAQQIPDKVLRKLAGRADLVAKIGSRIAAALAEMHNADLVHGEICGQRIAWSDNKPILLRDVAYLPGTNTDQAKWLDAIDNVDDAAWLAAEAASTQQDVRALCRFLYNTLHPEHPLQVAGPSASGTDKRQFAWQSLRDAAAAGPNVCPLMRVLAFGILGRQDTDSLDAATLVTALQASASATKPKPEPKPKPELKPKPKPEPKPKPNTDPQRESKPQQNVSPEPKSIPTPDPASSVPAKPRVVVVRRRKQSPLALAILGLLGAVVIGQIVYLALVDVQPIVVVRERPPAPRPENIPPVRNRPRQPIPAADKADPMNSDTLARYQIVADDRLLFVPPNPTGDASNPTAEVDDRSDIGDELAWLPAGPSAVIVWRPARWFASDKNASTDESPSFGNRWLDALGPDAQSAMQRAQQTLGVPWETIDHLAITLYPGTDANAWVAAVCLNQPVSVESLQSAWDAEPFKMGDSGTGFRSAGDDSAAYFVPRVKDDTSGNQVDAQCDFFVVGTQRTIRLAAATEGAPATLPSALNRLWRKRHAGDLDAGAIPNFVFANSRVAMRRVMPEWLDTARGWFIPDVSAIVVTAQRDDDAVFLEARVQPAAGFSQARLLRTFTDRIGVLPTQSATVLASADVDPSWQTLADRYEAMLGYVTSQIRFGISDGQVTANTYLPMRAATQFTTASYLLANTPEKSRDLMVAAAELSLDEMLARPMTVSFDQESLKRSLETVIEQFVADLPDGVPGPTLEINGGDLEKDGITQNQQVRQFAAQDEPLGSVLTRILESANPDRTATGPADPKQKLVWVTTAEPPKIIVTTRAAASQRGQLPAVFQTQTPVETDS